MANIRRPRRPRARRARRGYRRGYRRGFNQPMRAVGNVGLFGANSVSRKMVYCENATITCTAGAIGNYLFSANGLYDPNTTGGGHQPVWFDQIMPYFFHYCVLGSKIQVTFTHSGNPLSVPISVGVALRGNNTTQGSYVEYIENGNSVNRVLAPDPSARVLVTKSFSARKFFGKKYTQDNYDLKGTVSSNPVEDAYFQLYADPLTGVNDATINCLVKITYYAIFSEARPASQS